MASYNLMARGIFQVEDTLGDTKPWRKWAQLCPEFCFLPCCSPHFIWSILTNPTTLEHRSWCFGQHPAVKCVLFFCMIHSTGDRKAVPRSSESKNVCQSLAEKMFVWAEHSGVLPKEEQERDSERGERGHLWRLSSSVLFLYSEWRKGKRESPLEDIQNIRPSFCFKVLP